jgi:hypothetical protein
VHSFEVAGFHDRFETPSVFTAIENYRVVATLSERLYYPGANATLRAGDEISLWHLFLDAPAERSGDGALDDLPLKKS